VLLLTIFGHLVLVYEEKIMGKKFEQIDNHKCEIAEIEDFEEKKIELGEKINISITKGKEKILNAEIIFKEDVNINNIIAFYPDGLFGFKTGAGIVFGNYSQ